MGALEGDMGATDRTGFAKVYVVKSSQGTSCSLGPRTLTHAPRAKSCALETTDADAP